jgi:hypothetical protein
MLETGIVQGSIRIVGKVHGAMNTVVTWNFNNPGDWEFKQFVSDEQLEQFATEHHLQIIYPPKEE